MKVPAAPLALLVLISMALAQQPPTEQPYQPAVPPPSMGAYGGGYGYGMTGGVGSTAAGSAMTGMANVVSAKGDYNLATSAAAVNMTQAQRNEIQNRQLYTNTYFEMRETNRQARAAESGPRLTAEQISRIAHETAPKPLSSSEVNHVTGKLNWPDVFQMDVFSADRANFERLMGSYSQVGTLSYGDKTKARALINNMAKELKQRIREIPGPDYIASRSFLESLMYSTCNCRLS
jgi:hypothetical protein